ncbi:MAG: hypothetical protein ITF99_09810 [Chryseobacterium sp.]|nr:hypothetical protein [Chryseobacterium sp.]
MTTAELKIDLINKITKIKELRIIEEIHKFLDFELGEGEYKVNIDQKNRIGEAQNDHIMDEDDANNAIEEWLNEK